jgi:KipI family sensor histidine kinase inhibitor
VSLYGHHFDSGSIVDRRAVRFGETALLIEPLPAEDTHELTRLLRDLDLAEDVLPGSRILVRTTENRIDPVLRALRSIPPCRTPQRSPRIVEIPVSFDGVDLGEIAAAAKTTERDVVEQIARASLTVAYLGFSPGFPYMTGLPAELGGIGRRATPRASVPAGSVGLAAGYLGIYPQSSPGGWNLVGRTDFLLFDPQVPPYSALQAGDLVRVVPVENLGATPGWAAPQRPRCASPSRLVVEEPGALTTLQDSGRRGVGHLGVPRAGPADPDLMRLANIVCGNNEDDGVLETTLFGPSLRFDAQVHLVVMGAELEVDGGRLDPGIVVPVRPGGRVRIGRSSGLRGYLAVCGGIRGPELFGSCSSDLLSGLGTGKLLAGDELRVGEPHHPRGYAPPIERSSTVRILPVEPGNAELTSSVSEGSFTVGADSNRIGVRLYRRAPEETSRVGGRGDAGSFGMIEGAVQLAPGGEAIVLLCDHATMGGYPVVGTVISADLGTIAQRRPGEWVRFELVDLAEARRARAELDRRLLHGPTGHFPTSEV